VYRYHKHKGNLMPSSGCRQVPVKMAIRKTFSVKALQITPRGAKKIDARKESVNSAISEVEESADSLAVDFQRILSQYNQVVSVAMKEANDLFEKQKKTRCIKTLHSLLIIVLAANDIENIKKVHIF
jgi:hypothetical protein